jgi:selenocysteine lyase/cysteine desulfurase
MSINILIALLLRRLAILCQPNKRMQPTAFTLAGKSPRQVAEELDEANIFMWDGNYYALEVTKRLGLEDSGGMVRVGPVHYNTIEEIKKFSDALSGIATSSG